MTNLLNPRTLPEAKEWLDKCTELCWTYNGVCITATTTVWAFYVSLYSPDYWEVELRRAGGNRITTQLNQNLKNGFKEALGIARHFLSEGARHLDQGFPRMSTDCLDTLKK